MISDQRVEARSTWEFDRTSFRRCLNVIFSPRLLGFWQPSTASGWGPLAALFEVASEVTFVNITPVTQIIFATTLREQMSILPILLLASSQTPAKELEVQIADAKKVVQDIAATAHREIGISADIGSRVVGLRWKLDKPDDAVAALALCLNASVERNGSKVTIRSGRQDAGVGTARFWTLLEQWSAPVRGERALQIISRLVCQERKLRPPSMPGQTVRLWISEDDGATKLNWSDLRGAVETSWDQRKLKVDQRTQSMLRLRGPIGVLYSVGLTPAGYEVGCLICTKAFEFIHFESASIPILEPKSRMPAVTQKDKDGNAEFSAWLSLARFKPSWQKMAALASERSAMQVLSPAMDSLPALPLYERIARALCQVAGSTKTVAIAFSDLMVSWGTQMSVQDDIWSRMASQFGLAAMECIESPESLVVRPSENCAQDLVVDQEIMKSVCMNWRREKLEFRDVARMYAAATRDGRVEAVESMYIRQASFAQGGVWPISDNYSLCLAFLGSLTASQFEATFRQGLPVESIPAMQKERLLDALLGPSPWVISSIEGVPPWGEVMRRTRGLFLTAEPVLSSLLGNPDRDAVSNKVDWSRLTPEQLGTELAYLSKARGWTTTQPLLATEYHTAAVSGIRLSVRTGESVKAFVDIPLELPNWSVETVQLGKLERPILDRILSAFKRIVGDLPDS